MGEVGVAAFKMGIKMSYALSMVVLLVVFIALGVSAISVALNGSVVMDLVYLMQMWLPFNLNPLFTWLFTAVASYFAYRLSFIGFSIIQNVVD